MLRTEAPPARRHTRIAAVLAALFVLTGLPPAAAPAATARTAPMETPEAPAPAEGPAPIDFATVVDVSASIDKDDLALEADAAALIAQGEISERSRATVIGFGSADEPGQQAVRETCPLTVVDTAGRQELSDCAQGLRDRKGNGAGPGTDFPAAITQAIDRLGKSGGDDTPKVVFLLTDGKLDVTDSPSYGADEAARQANGERKLREVLARARRERMQIWPLGFGKSIDKDALKAMADGGYRNGCADLPGAKPGPTVVDGAADVDQALQEAFAAARCAQVEKGSKSKPPGELTVSIPPIATDGSITVTKRDPRVTVTYHDPKGRKVPVDGTFDGSRFEVSGQDGPVEALRVKDPLPGEWTVKLAAPEGHRDQVATVRAIWQGVLRSSVTMDPPSPRPGEDAVVRVRMQTRRGVVLTDPDQLAAVKVTVRLTGDGFEPVDVPLRDQGEAPDERAGDGQYAAGLTVPADASGTLALTSEMVAPGVTGDQRPFSTRVSAEAPPVTAGVSLAEHTAHPGGEVTGTLTVRNDDSRPHTLRLGIEDQPRESAVQISPPTAAVEPGAQEQVPVTVAFGSDTPLGETGGRITVTDLADEDRELGSAFLTVTVTPTPSWWDEMWDRWWAAIVLGAALLLAAALALGVRVWDGRERSSLQGLVLELRKEGRPTGELKVRGVRTKVFFFTVDNAASARPSLRRRESGTGSAYRLSRKGDGLRLLPPKGREQPVPRSGPLALDHDLELFVHSGRGTGRGRTPGRGQGPRVGGGNGARPTGGRGPGGERGGRASHPSGASGRSGSTSGSGGFDSAF